MNFGGFEKGYHQIVGIRASEFEIVDVYFFAVVFLEDKIKKDVDSFRDVSMFLNKLIVSFKTFFAEKKSFKKKKV